MAACTDRGRESPAQRALWAARGGRSLPTVSATEQPHDPREERVTQPPPEEQAGRRTAETAPTSGPAPYPDTGDEAPDGGSARPRWASVLGIFIAVVVVLLIVVLHLTGVIDAGGH